MTSTLEMTLGELCESIDYGVTTSANFTNVMGPKFLRITDLGVNGVDWQKVPHCIVSSSDERSCLLQDGDIVVARTGGTVGKSFLVQKPPRAVSASYLLRLRPRLERVLPEYLNLFFGSDRYWSQLMDAARGAAQPNVNATTLSAIAIKVPSLKEQHRIAAQLKAQLAAAEQARQAAQAQAWEFEVLVLALYRDAFAHIVPVAIPPAFEAAPEDWRWAKLSDLARLESGHTPSRSRPDWWGGTISWVSLTEIRKLDGCWVEETEIKTNKQGIANSAARILPRGTVCFSRTASVGFVTIMGQPMATSQDFANWVCGDDLAPEFLMYALIRSRNELRALATGATHKTIYMPTLEEFYLCLPKREVQERIVKDLKVKLSALEQARQAARVQLQDIEQLPARLLAQAFEVL